MRLLTIALLLLFAMLLGYSGGKTQKATNQGRESNPDQESNQAQDYAGTSAADSGSVYKIRFERAESYGSTDEVVIGQIATFAVDDQNHVFIADRNQTTVHVFKPDGSYLTSLGCRGNGPGEFTELNRYTTMAIHSNQLFVTDFLANVPKGIQVFLLEELSFSHTIKLVAENRNDYRELQGYSTHRFFPLNEGRFLVSYRRPFYDYTGKASFVYYV